MPQKYSDFGEFKEMQYLATLALHKVRSKIEWKNGYQYSVCLRPPTSGSENLLN